MTGTFYNKALAVSKSDTVNWPYVETLGPAQGLWVGTKGSTGTVVLVLPDGNTVQFTNVAAGTLLPVLHIRVNSTTTDASDFIALWQV